MPRASLMSEMSGGTSVQGITKQFRQAMADESVGAIILDIDSPGGQVGGDRGARDRDPGLARPEADRGRREHDHGVGRVLPGQPGRRDHRGAVVAHGLDRRLHGLRRRESRGRDGRRRRHDLQGRKYKAEGAYGPLSEEAAAAVQQRIDDYYGQFVGAVAKGRGVTAAAVRSGYGEGRALTADRAKAAGLVDRIDTFDGAIRRLATGRVTTRPTSALEAAGGVALEPLADGEFVGSLGETDEPTGQLPAAIDDNGGTALEPLVAAADPARELELAAARARMHGRR
jgi:ClpP class serine protease